MSSSPSYMKYETRKRDPDPKTSVLLVIDMQNKFYSMAEPILPAVNTTIELCRDASIPIIFTRQCHKSPQDYGMLYEWWDGDVVMDGTPEADLIPALDRREDDLVVDKNTYSAFRGTNLEQKLMQMDVKEVMVTGVTTNVCCETSAREAFVRGFRVFFSTDATATLTIDLHDATLKNLAYGFAYLFDCKRLHDAFSKSLTDYGREDGTEQSNKRVM